MRKHSRDLLSPEIKKRGLTVTVRTKNGQSDIDTAIRILKKNMNKEGITREMRKREYFESKGQKDRRKKAEAIRRRRKMLQEMPADEW